MSKEKQIEEMTEIIKPFVSGTACEEESGSCEFVNCQYCRARDVARMIYAKVYSKQREGEWKQTTEPLGAHNVDCVECSACGDSWVLDEDFGFDDVKDFWHFCPTCGAKMKGGTK